MTPAGRVQLGPAKNHTVTLALALVGPDYAVLAADSLRAEIRNGAPGSGLRRSKLCQHGSRGALLAGLSAIDDVDLLDVLDQAIAEADTLDSAARAFTTAMGEAIGRHHDDLAGLYEEREVVWEAVLVERDSPGIVGLRLRGYREDGQLTGLKVDRLGGRPYVVTCGAEHPLWQHRSTDYIDSFEDLRLIAIYQRRPMPTAPEPIEVTLATARRTAATLVTEAIRTEHLADRSVWWPAGCAVAAGPVEVVEL